MNQSIFLFRLLPALITAIVISLVAMPAIIKIASLKKLTDEPDGERKRHEHIVPTLGGIGIFASFLISFSVWGDAESLQSYPYFVAALFMLFLIGVKDDILVLSPLKKLLIQFIASAEIVIGGGVVLRNLEGLFGAHQIPWAVGVIITTLIIVIIINAYNLIDGIDGLAGGIGMIIAIIAGGWFLISGFSTMATLSFVLAGAIWGFLIFNFYPAKIFMGDTGAMAVGFILAYILLQFVTFNQTHPESAFHISNAPIYAVALFIIPVVDTLRVIVLRLISGKNPLVADYNHIHHAFIKAGFSPHVAAAALWIGNLLIIGQAYYFSYLEPNILLLLILLSGFLILPVVNFVRFLLVKFLPDKYAEYIMKRGKKKHSW